MTRHFKSEQRFLTWWRGLLHWWPCFVIPWLMMLAGRHAFAAVRMTCSSRASTIVGVGTWSICGYWRPRGGCSSRTRNSRIWPCSTSRSGTGWSKGRPGRVVDPELLRHDLRHPPTAARALHHIPAKRPGPVVQPDGRRQTRGSQAAIGTGWRPMGACADAHGPGGLSYKQGDGRTAIHDWGMEFTAAGVVLQGELLLISLDAKAIAHYLPLLERSANFIETPPRPGEQPVPGRPTRQSAGAELCRMEAPDGTYEKAYPGRAVGHLHRGAGPADRVGEAGGSQTAAALYAQRRELARRGLSLLTTDEGYLSARSIRTASSTASSARSGTVTLRRRPIMTRSPSAWRTTPRRNGFTGRSRRCPACGRMISYCPTTRLRRHV